MAEQVKTMKLKVDLGCQKCYKKVKKVLCKFPEIRDQEYDQKQNIVTIKVKSCNPEKIRDKLCCKGGGSIKSIEILDPPKPKPPEPDKKKEKEKKDEPKPKPPPEPKTQPTAPEPQPKPQTPPPEPTPITTPTTPSVNPAAMFPEPAPVSVLAYPPPVAAIPVGVYYEGHAGYGGYYGRPIYDSYGGRGGPGYVSGSNQYWSEEENASGCTIV